MSREFLSTFTLLEANNDIQRAGIDFLLGRGQAPAGFGHLTEVVDLLARVDLLAQATATGIKDYARAGLRGGGGGLLQLYRSQAFQEALVARRRQMADLGLLPALPDLAFLPAGSFAIHFTFTLRTPYISKDDVGLHILDNPVRKDRTFGLPMVASTGWKGALRAALRQVNDWNDDHAILVQLFGTARDDETGQAGRLYFYPTFFAQLGLEVINPHDRRSNAGKQPIYFESVPDGVKGDYALLYAPIDCIGQEEVVTRRQAAADLLRIAEGLRAMFTIYGFGAKTSSGFGAAKENVEDGFIQVRIEETPAAPPASAEPAQPAPQWLTRPFASFDELIQVSQAVAGQLAQEVKDGVG